MKYTEEQIMSEAETRVFKRLITETYPSGVVSVVSDTFDFWHAITVIAPKLKEEILARTPDQLGLAKTVFRPDSGDPVLIVCGNPEAVPGTPEYKGAIQCLDEVFGSTTNEKGFKTLNPRVGLIYGDSITPQRAEQILFRLAEKGYASDNIVFGIGSYTFQYATRDSLGFAMKATYVEIDGVGQAIFKDPKTDNGTKKSARGLLAVHKAPLSGDYMLVDGVTAEGETKGELKTVFLNGGFAVPDSFEELRARLKGYM